MQWLVSTDFHLKKWKCQFFDCDNGKSCMIAMKMCEHTNSSVLNCAVHPKFQLVAGNTISRNHFHFINWWQIHVINWWQIHAINFSPQKLPFWGCIWGSCVTPNDQMMFREKSFGRPWSAFSDGCCGEQSLCEIRGWKCNWKSVSQGLQMKT